MKPILLVLLAFVLALASPAQSPARWYKGNTHAHTTNSDGDSTPEEVVKWYRDNGYNFLVVTDHEHITPVAPLNNAFGKTDEFLVISGQEITDSAGGKPQHVNALGIGTVTMPKKQTGSLQNLQANIDAAIALGGVPQINHPNFGWALTADTIAKTKGVMLFELFNGHFLVNNMGGGGSPSTEQIWDAVLSSGRLIYGTATDDVHTVRKLGDRASATPGHGWVMVRASELTPKGILDALTRGDFYASTGVELESYSADAKTVSVKVKEKRGSKYRIQFIGRNGKLLQEVPSNSAVHRFKRDEGYIRVKVLESNGTVAWTQPHIIAN